jgi:hypothetical protein
VAFQGIDVVSIDVQVHTLPLRRGPLRERHVVSPGVSPRFISGRLRRPLMPLVLHLLRQSRPARGERT